MESIRDIAPVRYRGDLFLRKGTERLLQERIEAAIDLNTHLLVQSGQAPPDDYFRGFTPWPDEEFYLRTLPPPSLLRRASGIDSFMRRTVR